MMGAFLFCEQHSGIKTRTSQGELTGIEWHWVLEAVWR
ncbi:hypothetical protein AC09_3040 [Escherichia coli 6-175-07_S3_C1]|nr:hypothetical protein AD15_3774 [Escherichia coli 3-105-05_S4_C2]KEJ76058.1 hypothetical protein AC37_3474 [Escherichia coli 6-175-07_S3_C2]KEL91627.1 hypothetical protein AC09_3040 [Escherichia coli 6-175-07_S3_C1]KEM00458.1 hypothetical protein AC62_3217 [Escherichia coli 6-175-07_S3_C3]KEM20343.1 hypothetical protein AC10_3178 [Escherichia coli 6-319-05_S3_C1]KEM29190.1 hypothetical protein AC38_3195 [Escherichia coli 6-319-05_S3_C2]KEM60360.1 hypothetical protein AC63_3119 [Escherichia 